MEFSVPLMVLFCVLWIRFQTDLPCYDLVVVRPADAQPTEAEREVWEQVDVVLKDAKGILDELQAYKGAGVEIREVHLTNIPVQWSGTGRCCKVRTDMDDMLHLSKEEVLKTLLKNP